LRNSAAQHGEQVQADRQLGFGVEQAQPERAAQVRREFAACAAVPPRDHAERRPEQVGQRERAELERLRQPEKEVGGGRAAMAFQQHQPGHRAQQVDRGEGGENGRGRGIARGVLPGEREHGQPGAAADDGQYAQDASGPTIHRGPLPNHPILGPIAGDVHRSGITGAAFVTDGGRSYRSAAAFG